MRFIILNLLGADRECDIQTDGRTEPALAIARSNNPPKNQALQVGH